MMTHTFIDPRRLLGKYGLRPKKSFGQNFLVADPVVQKIANLCIYGSVRDARPNGANGAAPIPSRDDAAHHDRSNAAAGNRAKDMRVAVDALPAPNPLVVEIGGGLGTLTAALLERGGEVVVIERDRDLIPVLAAEFADDVTHGHLTIVEADAVQVDFAAYFADRAAPSAHASSAQFQGPRVLAGNLPYQITGRLLERAVALAHTLDRVVVMVQREVGDRLAATPGSDAYGQLSVFAQARFEVRKALSVSAGCFHPRPAVDSAVVMLTPLARPRALETETFREVVHAAFGARRKTMRNAIAPLIQRRPHLDGPAAIARVGIDLGRRGETLSVEEFARLARAIDGNTELL
ncbi:MAG: 16S rRNA (adenine(1518)-N(6)/adenine(1519)-N(6)) -dimethyltransferase RsmA [Polyangiales bacterium]